MTLLMAFDPATKCGWATYEDLGRGRKPRVECGSFTADGDTEGQLFSDFARKASALLVEKRPIRVAVEMRMPTSAGHWEDSRDGELIGGKQWKTDKFDGAAKRQDGLRAVLLATISAPRPKLQIPAGIQYVEVAVATWRRSFFGAGVKPPVSEREAGKSRQWWKREAKMKAASLGLQLGFTVPNADAAEAVGIVFWLAANERRFMAEDLLSRASA